MIVTDSWYVCVAAPRAKHHVAGPIIGGNHKYYGPIKLQDAVARSAVSVGEINKMFADLAKMYVLDELRSFRGSLFRIMGLPGQLVLNALSFPTATSWA